MLARRFGLPFILGYVASYMLVAMGIFNVILAVYVDITMRAAKENEATTAEQYSRESVRIARTTRELLKFFANAYNQFEKLEDKQIENALHGRSKSKIGLGTPAGLFTDDEHIEGDLPHDGANLFEIIDADGSGSLGLAELVQGLLKIRGEINKSDTVAALLATKAVQAQLSEMMEAGVKALLEDHSQNAKKLERLSQELQGRFMDLTFRMGTAVDHGYEATPRNSKKTTKDEDGGGGFPSLAVLDLPLPDLQKKVAELELQLGLARKQADSEPQPEGSSSVETRLLGSRETRESRERQVMSTFSEGLLPPLATTGSGEVTPRSTVEFNISKVNNANAGSRAASDASPSHSASEASRAASDASERRAPNIDTSISAMTSMSMEDMATGPQLVTGKALHDAVMALGLTRYSLEDCNEMLGLVLSGFAK
eukprot:g23844.t1